MKENFVFINDEDDEPKDMEYTLRDFLSVFTQDDVGATIVKVINHEIQLKENAFKAKDLTKEQVPFNSK